MTENTFDAEPVAEGQSRRTLLIAAGGAGALVLVAGGWFLLHGSGSDTSAGPALPTHPVGLGSNKAKPLTTKKIADKTVTKLPTASSVKIGRDPFAALYIAPTTTGDGSGSSGSGSPAAGSGATGSTPSGTASNPTTAGSTTGTTTGARYALTLTKVTSDPGGAKLFTFAIGKENKTVLPAQRFGKYGELVVLTYIKNSRGAVIGAVLQVGDDNPIEIAVGQKTSVQ